MKSHLGRYGEDELIPRQYDGCRPGSLAIYSSPDRYAALVWYITKRWGLETSYDYEIPGTEFLPDTNEGRPLHQRIAYYDEGGVGARSRFALWLKPVSADCTDAGETDVPQIPL